MLNLRVSGGVCQQRPHLSVFAAALRFGFCLGGPTPANGLESFQPDGANLLELGEIEMASERHSPFSPPEAEVDLAPPKCPASLLEASLKARQVKSPGVRV